MSIKADNYVTTLGPEMLKRAKDEFGEIERLRETNIIAMRDWIKKQPHFMSSMTTNAMFLTKFIRICKFSLEEAKKKLDSMLTVRTALPDFFSNWDPMESSNQEALNCGAFLPLIGYDYLGRKALVVRPCAFDPNLIAVTYLIKASSMVIALMWEEDEQMSITGQVIIVDMKGFSYDHFAQLTLALAIKTMALKNAFPHRIKVINIVNTPSNFELVRPFINFILNKDKMIRKIVVHGDNFESLKKDIPQGILPKDYGGNGISTKKLKKYWKDKAKANREFLMKFENMYKADESKRPFGIPKTSDELFGIEGSFRKLNID